MTSSVYEEASAMEAWWRGTPKWKQNGLMGGVNLGEGVANMETEMEQTQKQRGLASFFQALDITQP